MCTINTNNLKAIRLHMLVDLLVNIIHITLLLRVLPTHVSHHTISLQKQLMLSDMEVTAINDYYSADCNQFSLLIFQSFEWY